jgi:sulfur carrier protein ThiS
VSVKTDTRAAKDEVAIVSGIAIEDHPVEMPDATTMSDLTGETEIPTKTVVAVEEIDARTDFQHSRSAVARAHHLRSESQLQI